MALFISPTTLFLSKPCYNISVSRPVANSCGSLKSFVLYQEESTCKRPLPVTITDQEGKIYGLRIKTTAHLGSYCHEGAPDHLMKRRLLHLIHDSSIQSIIADPKLGPELLEQAAICHQELIKATDETVICHLSRKIARLEEIYRALFGKFPPDYTANF